MKINSKCGHGWPVTVLKPHHVAEGYVIPYAPGCPRCHGAPAGIAYQVVTEAPISPSVAEAPDAAAAAGPSATEAPDGAAAAAGEADGE